MMNRGTTISSCQVTTPTGEQLLVAVPPGNKKGAVVMGTPNSNLSWKIRSCSIYIYIHYIYIHYIYIYIHYIYIYIYTCVCVCFFGATIFFFRISDTADVCMIQQMASLKHG